MSSSRNGEFLSIDDAGGSNLTGFSNNRSSIFGFNSVSSIVLSDMAKTVATTMAVMLVTMMETLERKEEEDKKGKMKKSPFSKQVGFVLEIENNFFLEIKEGNPKLLGGDVKGFFWKNKIL